MRNLLRAGALAAVLALAAGGAAQAEPHEGCVAIGEEAQCSYVAAVPGSIAGVGAWRVEIWWAGECGVGDPDWVRGSDEGSNNAPGGAAGTWEGSIAPGACALATSFTSASAVIIGGIDTAA